MVTMASCPKGLYTTKVTDYYIFIFNKIELFLMSSQLCLTEKRTQEAVQKVLWPSRQ